MNPRFKIGVIAFGLVLPLLGIFLLIGVLLSQKKRVDTEYAEREKIFNQNKASKMQTQAVALQLKSYEARSDQWEELLETSDISKVTGVLKEILDEFGGGETFDQDNFSYVNNETGIGAASMQPSISFNLVYSGTFRSLQESLLTLETRMPNLNLTSLELTPKSNGPLLQAKLSYSAWTK